MLRIFSTKHYDVKIFENHLNPVLLVFIGKHSLSTLRCEPICQGFHHFFEFLHHFILAKLATSSIKAKKKILFVSCNGMKKIG